MTEIYVQQLNTKFIVLDNELTYISNSGNYSVHMRCVLCSTVLFSEICKTISDHCGSGDAQLKTTGDHTV